MIENGARLRSPSGSSVNGVLERIGSPEPAESNGEDLEEDDPGEHVGVEDTIKAEEVGECSRSSHQLRSHKRLTGGSSCDKKVGHGFIDCY